jgi:hypothetical protein
VDDVGTENDRARTVVSGKGIPLCPAILICFLLQYSSTIAKYSRTMPPVFPKAEINLLAPLISEFSSVCVSVCLMAEG